MSTVTRDEPEPIFTSQPYHVNVRQQDDGSWIAYLVERLDIYAYGYTPSEAVSILFLLCVPIEQEREVCV